MRLTLSIFLALDFALFLARPLAHADSLADLEGEMRGTVTNPSTSNPKPVKALIKPASGATEVLIQSLEDPNASWDFQITFLRKGRLSLSLAQTQLSEVRLEPDSDDCASSDDPQVTVCVMDSALTLEVPDLKFYFARHSGEAPQEYTLEELRSRSADRSFESRIEFEHRVQARAMARNAKLNLLPHLSNTSIIGAITGDKAGLLGSVGDLVPFLLPNRWFQKAEMKQRSAAETDALETMRVDAMFQTEGLALGLLRDLEAVEKLKAGIARTSEIRDELLFRERLGQIQPGVHDDATSLIVQIQKSLAILQESIREEYLSLGQSVGFTNPDAISRLKPLNESGQDAIEPVTADERWAGIDERSSELRQIDHLIVAARYNQKGRWFTWLDPAGDPTGGIGFGFPSYVEVGASQVRELQVRREQMQAALRGRLNTIVAQANLEAQLYRTATQEHDLQQARVKRLVANIQVGAAFALSDLINALQDSTRNEIDWLAARYNYWTARAALRRLERTGVYATPTDP